MLSHRLPTHTPAPPTVHDLLVFYQQEYLPQKAATTRYTIMTLYRRIDADLGSLLLSALTADRLRTWRDTLSRQYAPGTVRRFLDTLSGPLTIAVRDLEWLESNPLRKVRKPPETPGRTRILTEAERRCLLAACQRSRCKILYLVVVVALATGARKHELLWMRWEHVDLVRGMLRLAQTKNGDRRSVPLTGLARTLLLAYHTGQHSGWVFPGEASGPLNIDHSWKRVTKEAGLLNLHFHDLRHTFASYLAMSGASLTELAELLGHRQMKMVQKYTHFTNSHLAGITARMTQEFLGE